MARSTLKEATPGRKVNLERALQATDRLGGHFVLGHVDGIGSLKEARREGEYLRVAVAPPPELLRYIVEKGSIAVDGVSLTVNGVDTSGFSLMLIPTTIAQTTLAEKRPGDKVNIETDIIGKYIEKFLAARSSGVTLEKLREEGFS
jgi:riboflavin synthase